MGYLTRDQVKSADDRRFAEVECPEWGGTIRLSSISGRQRDDYEQSMVEQRGNDRKINMRNARAKLVILCAVDENGEKLFTAEDLRWLSAKNARPLDRLFSAAQDLVGLTESDMKDLTENFGETPDVELDSD